MGHRVWCVKPLHHAVIMCGISPVQTCRQRGVAGFPGHDGRGGRRGVGAQRERMERHSNDHSRRGRACGGGGRQVWPGIRCGSAQRKRYRWETSSTCEHIVITTPRLCIAART